MTSSVVPLGANGLVCAVADGVGGRPGGHWAAHTVVACLAETLVAGNTIQAVSAVLAAANERLTGGRGRGPGPATTVAGISCSMEQIVVFNIGDSRVYELNGSGAHLLSVDHRSRTDARSITRFLGGSSAHAIPQITNAGPPSARNFLICSDGFHSFLRESDFSLFLELDPAQALKALVEMSLDGGSNDNLSAIFCKTHSGNH